MLLPDVFMFLPGAQVLDERVAQGSKVLEAGHVVVLLWGSSQRDVSKLETVVRQLCAAYRGSGGTTIAVLSCREKLVGGRCAGVCVRARGCVCMGVGAVIMAGAGAVRGRCLHRVAPLHSSSSGTPPSLTPRGSAHTQGMETLFARQLPPEQRQGSRLVFRQGNPLSLADLDLVSAGDAGSVVVLSDTSVSPDAADSQLIHVLVLLDEMEGRLRSVGRVRPQPGHVVAEFQVGVRGWRVRRV